MVEAVCGTICIVAFLIFLATICISRDYFESKATKVVYKDIPTHVPLWTSKTYTRKSPGEENES